MNPGAPPISEEDLHAWADGRLPTARRTAVDAWLAGQPEALQRAEAWRDQNAAMHRRFDPVLAEPIPEALIAVTRRDTRHARAWPTAFASRQAAAVAWLALGAVIGFFAHDLRDSPEAATLASLPRQAALAHAVFVPEAKHPVEVGGEQENHLAAWLSKRLGGKLQPPHLDTAGYALVGGRLLPGDDVNGGGAVAQFMYQDARGKRLTLYVRNDAVESGGAAFRFAQEGKIGVFYWIDGHFGYALSGEMPKDELSHVASIVYHQFVP